MVLESLLYAKSAMKNFDQSEATFGSHMTNDFTRGHFFIQALFL